MFNISDKRRDRYKLTGPFARKGYDWWWHSFTGVSERTGRERAFFVEYDIDATHIGCEYGEYDGNGENI